MRLGEYFNGCFNLVCKTWHTFWSVFLLKLRSPRGAGRWVVCDSFWDSFWEFAMTERGWWYSSEDSVTPSAALSLGEVYFELSADKICRATAQMLLQNAVKFNLAEFHEVWQQSVPEGMTTRLDQLKVRGDVTPSMTPQVTRWKEACVGTEYGDNLFPYLRSALRIQSITKTL